MGVSFQPGERVITNLPLIMLYPLLKWDTSFPAGFSGETVDLLLKDASSRTLRARTEATTRNYKKHEILQSELDNLRPRTWVAERQRIDDSRRAARGFSVNKFETNRSDRGKEYKSCASKLGSPVFFGRSASFLERTRYLPATPKIRSEYPIFHTGFTYYPTEK